MNITIKNEDEIELMKVAGKVLGEALYHLKEMIKPGINCLELDSFFKTFIEKNNCQSNFKNYYGYPAYTCISVNEQLIHAIPRNYLLRSGDIVSIDAGCIYKGYNADAAFTKICGDSKDPEHTKIVEVTEKSLYLAIEKISDGVRIGTLSSTIQKYVQGEGFYLPVEFSGHGIGKQMHEDPLVPNTGSDNTGMRLKEGMTICIEPMVQIGTAKIKILDDKWTVVSKDSSMAAHFEHTILVTKKGYEILTTIKPMED